MINQINSNNSILQTSQTTSSKIDSEQLKSSAPSSDSTLKIDKITISADGLNKYKESVSNETTPTKSWELFSGFESGETTLENGNKQVVTINGSKMELLEYKSGKLIRSVKGELTTKGAILDTEIYDEAGKISQTIRTSLETLNGNSNETAAQINRTVKWFDNGEMTRQMNDRMRLQSEYNDPTESLRAVNLALKNGTEAQIFSLEDINDRITHDTQTTQYYASIQEYANDKLSSDITIKNNAKFVNETNRSPNKIISDRKPMTTKEVYHELGFSIQIQNYDSDGNLLRDAMFNSKEVDGPGTEGGKVEQNMSVSWYNKGALVKKSHGSLRMDESPNQGLPWRATMLETIGVKEKDYASTETKTATELLANPLMESSSKAEFYTNTLDNEIREGSFDTADTIAKHGENNRPYSISWENEIYNEGDLVARQENKESARENPRKKGLSFRTAGALTEDDSPNLIHSASHVIESYRDGKLSKQASVESRESINEIATGPDQIFTKTQSTEGTGYIKKRINTLSEGKLSELDPLANAASQSMALETNITLEDSRELLNSLDDKNSGPNNDEYKAMFVPS